MNLAGLGWFWCRWNTSFSFATLSTSDVCRQWLMTPSWCAQFMFDECMPWKMSPYIDIYHFPYTNMLHPMRADITNVAFLWGLCLILVDVISHICMSIASRRWLMTVDIFQYTHSTTNVAKLISTCKFWCVQAMPMSSAIAHIPYWYADCFSNVAWRL